MTEKQMTKDYFENFTYNRCDGPLCAICDIFFDKIKSSIRNNFVKEEYFDTTFRKDGFKLKKTELGGTNLLGGRNVDVTLTYKGDDGLELTYQEWEDMPLGQKSKYLKNFCNKQLNELAACIIEKQKTDAEISSKRNSLIG